MKIILVGANGTIGKEVYKELRKIPEHEIITASRTAGDYKVDISDTNQVRYLFGAVQGFDALINIAGYAHFGPFHQTTEADIYFGIRNKMMGQINLVMIGKELIRENGSFTLTSGFLSHDPIKGGMNYSMVNGAIEGFVKSAAIELGRGIRVNVVSPGNVDSESFYERFTRFNPGQTPVSMSKVVAAYIKSAMGFRTGQVYRVWEPSTQFVS